MSEPAIAASATPEVPKAPRKSSRVLRWAVRFGTVFAGLAVGLVVAELVFRSRDDGAFPHVNFYVADSALGVRLEPNAEERIAFGGNPVTSLRTNNKGYRGATWPAPGKDEILVVGDSQVFGLGVEETETFSAQLSKATGRTVINAGVPTYGPAEYKAVIAELIDQRKPTTVVLTLNMVNDLFEEHRPNAERHVVWDGWAVRKENAPAETSDFPFRSWLYRKSHLVFALRKWMHEGDPVGDAGLGSEGSWQDLVVAGEGVAKSRVVRTEQMKAQAVARREALAKLTAADKELEQAMSDARYRDESIGGYTDKSYEESRKRSHEFNAAKANVGDIVDDDFGEDARSIIVTAEHIRKGVQMRARLRAKLAEVMKASGKQADTAIAAKLGEREQAWKALTAPEAAELQKLLDPPLATYVRDVQALVTSRGARLVVVVLPIDVQVSETEWAKYDLPVTDMKPTLAYTHELVAATEAMGVSALDALPALAAAEPGAFLKGDIHMTAKGHAALAVALAKTIQNPPPAIATEAIVRSPVPLPPEWYEAKEIIVTGSTSAGCETKRVREWVRIMCGRTTKGDDPLRVSVTVDATRETLALAMPHQTSVVTPVQEGRDVVVDFVWTSHTRRLNFSWLPGAPKPTIAFEEPVKTGGRKQAVNPDEVYSYNDYVELSEGKVKFVSPVEETICDCWNQTFGGLRIKGKKGKPDKFLCSGAYGSPDPTCTAIYAKDCTRMLECIRRDPASPPTP